ncbi:MAG: methionine gamma-lyase family protein [Eubacteriales bacterium]|nr:methionine gamma-lyase family protein [Eubacteriales bacterium]MDD3882799.1 methionine gamma-lyase family protein [Eubacteriales bacterium]MDD4513303.1 methionine gamma-lyase family protein [Eubacteriales bacterium]
MDKLMIDSLVSDAEKDCREIFEKIDAVEEFNTVRVLEVFSAEEVAARHFAPTTGYGYDDVGRDTLERIFARLFHADKAIVRPHIVSGTHALSLCLFGLLLPGDELLSATGRPYDTMQTVIGLTDDKVGTLAEMGVSYRETEMKDGGIDVPSVLASVNEKTKVVMVQRSRGYAWRRSLVPSDIEPLARELKARFPKIILMVDNCYGEFICKNEPTDFGADVCVGSLIKNLGGGIAPTGGYLVGRADVIERIACRLTAPGIALEEGSYAASYRPFYQGLFMAPHTVSQALKTAVLAARTFEKLGMKTTPAYNETRGDIIQAIEMTKPERLVAFCQGIQMASPVDSMALPEPWDMPGYADKVIMAAGTFVSGASIELSADAPMREPYTAYMQGALTLAHGRIAIKKALLRMTEMGCL